jgi:hypothetical protein
MALKMLRVRVDVAGLGLVLGGTEATVWGWLRRAAHHADTINRPRRRAWPVTQGQLDELGNLIARKPTCETDAMGASGPDREDGRQWGGSSFAPALRVLSAALVGPRPLDTAQEGVAATTARVAGIPACCRDGFPCSLAALLAAGHVVTTLARTGKRGRPRKPRGEPHPALLYGQWVPQQKQGKLRTLRPRVVLGAARLTQRGLTISTALVARVHWTWRQALAPLVRKTSSFCKDRERLRHRVVLFQVFYPMASPHMRWRQPLPRHERTCHGAIQPRWRQRTPALAAGRTDHIWTFRELLTAKFEPLDSQSISG